MKEKLVISNPIIFVEDDHDDQYFFKSVCEELGISAELIFFENGKDALAFLKTTSKKIFIIICDINMPAMNGLELRNHINSDDYLRGKSIPFVFMSTAARDADVALAYDMTVQGFFTKESNFEGMQKTLRMIFEYWDKCRHPNKVKG